MALKTLHTITFKHSHSTTPRYRCGRDLPRAYGSRIRARAVPYEADLPSTYWAPADAKGAADSDLELVVWCLVAVPRAISRPLFAGAGVDEGGHI